MDAVGRVFGWLARKAIVFVALVGALIIHQLLLPTWRSHQDLRDEVARLRAGEQVLARSTRDLIGRSNGDVARAQQLSAASLDRRIAAAQSARQSAAAACRGDLDALLRGGAQQVIDSRKACLVAQMEARQVAVLTQLRGTIDARRPGESLPQAVRRQTTIMRHAAALNRQARGEIARLSGNPIDRFRYRERIARLTTSANRSAGFYNDAKGRAARLITAEQRLLAANAAAHAALSQIHGEYAAIVAKQGRALGGSMIERARGFARRVNLTGKLRTAAIALALIIATPFLIRLFCFFVLAPLAMRRAAIRLRVPDGRGVAIAPAAPSATSVSVRLDPGEELLVRQNYLQTSSHAGAKRTKWLLTWRKPFTSIATGLTFLTRIRGDGEVTTVSAVRDGLAEVTILTLPEGASCVLQPRALAAVAQPIRRRLRITRHWRLGSLNAWLTLQLRYLVFHGPARLVLKGGRGVRVERAEQGRVFGQDQLVGFSADLAYSVTRTETFWPYFLGREQLLKDRVMAGEGVLIVEEAPLTARRGEVRRGIEGMIDAGMKVFGM